MKSDQPRVNRRKFLAKSGRLLGLSFGLQAIVPGPALGRGGFLSPSERITMAFIGLGGQGTGHLLGGAWTYIPGGYIARNDVQVVAVCDVRAERRLSAQQRCNRMYAEKFGQATYKGVDAYNDFREVLARTDVDAVLLALPYHWAAPMAIMAARAGKDVYCEKPVAITVREGCALLDAFNRYGRVYQAGTQQRSEYGGKFRIACELVRNGKIGQLKEVYAYRLPGAFYPTPWTSDASQPVPAGFDWDLWLGPLPWRPYNGEAGHTLSGLFVGDVNWSPHHYDFIQWAVNPDRTAPIEVEVDGGKGSGGEDVVRYYYSNGVVVHSSAYPGELVGAEGGACLVGTRGRIAVDRGNIVSYPAEILKEPLGPEDERVYRSSSHSGNFLDCVRTRRKTICDPETAVWSMNTILIGGIAMILRRRLRWNPVKSEFENDDEANRLLSYTARPPWQF
ncbi:MAG: Gfo/Idh/MocA family oxidoreductase [Verrucomicrobiae bacterium]|nr:Gfo/Idh/MocA family oxidoreductase [Verrucomicrobiae bacterium]